jgi:hypothetical protein
MIRYVEVRGYFGPADDETGDFPNDFHFAFIDTVRDRFIEFGGEQFWETREAFAFAFSTLHEYEVTRP